MRVRLEWHGRWTEAYRVGERGELGRLERTFAGRFHWPRAQLWAWRVRVSGRE